MGNHAGAAYRRRLRLAWLFSALLTLMTVSACTNAGSSGGTNETHSSNASSAPVSPVANGTNPAQRPSGQLSAVSANPVLDGRGGVRNLTFYYRGHSPLEPGADLSALGHPSVVVTTPKTDERQAIQAIHGLGALAYRYVQYYWSPTNATVDGINLAKHPDWAFCRHGNQPLLGQLVKVGDTTQTWYFIDMNEAAVRAAIERQFRALKAEGWDGVLFDRGYNALTDGPDASGKPVWNVRSTCTSHPYQKGATFAQSYINTLGLAHQAGLQTMMNFGTSPFDPVTPMPAEAWKNLNLVLDEMATHPHDKGWSQTFTGLQEAEQNAAHGHRTVALITTANLGGPTGQTRSNVYYEWARVKLFNLAVAVNTGDAECSPHPHNGICNLYGLYPELVDLRFGRPVGSAPAASGCLDQSKINCIWTRSYVQGSDVVNASPLSRQDVTVQLASGSCRYVYDVFDKRPLAGDRCVKAVSLNLPPWSGRPLMFGSKPF